MYCQIIDKTLTLELVTEHLHTKYVYIPFLKSDSGCNRGGSSISSRNNNTNHMNNIINRCHRHVNND